MKPLSCNLIRSTAAVCLLMVSGFVHAEDGVVRISDKSSAGASNSGIARISDRHQQMVRPASHLTVGDGTIIQPDCCVPADCCVPQGCCPSEGCDTYGRQFVCSQPGMADGCCDGQGCCPGQCHGGCQNGCNFGQCHQERMYCLFAGSACSGTGCKAHDLWRGHSLSFQAKNSRLAHKLFGWMIPSGCCGQGCPPVGKYHITYADDPAYADPRDSQIYAAQGYGMPMTVPLAPNVYQQYNYSWGVPASRITPISNYNPMTSPQPLYHQSW